MDDHHQQDGSYNWSPMWAPSTASKRKLEYDSWEERAFAEDAAGLLGSGCVWPPRSYTCSFCRREFRSAQALGGHMNVHRRDRARLKQLPNTPQDHQSRGGGGAGGGGGSGGGFLDSPSLLKVDPNYTKCPSTHNSPNPNYLFYSSSSSSSNGVGNPMLSTSFVGPNREMQGCNFSSPSNFHQQNPQDHRLNRGKRDAKLIEVECRDHGINEGGTKCAKSELSISLSLVVRRNRPEEDHEASCFKRRKIVAASSDPSPPLIFLSESGGVNHMSKIEINAPRKVHGLREIDLELRLGG